MEDDLLSQFEETNEEEEQDPLAQFEEVIEEPAPQAPAQPASQPSEQDIMRQNALPSSANPATVPQPTMDPAVVEDVVNRPEQGPAAPFRQFTTDIYDDVESFDEAMQIYADFYDDPNTSRPVGGVGYATQTNPETGERTYITPPAPRWFRSGARTSAADLAAVGLAAGAGNAVELAGAGLELAGVDGATEAADRLIPEVNTGDSFGDAIIAEGVPVLAASLVGAGLAWKASQGANLLARGTAATISGETAAAAVSENDAGSIFIGENSMIGGERVIPILRGVDLESTDAQAVIEARLNLLADGLLAGGVVAAGAQAVATATKLAYNVAAEPLVNVMFRGDAGIEDNLINDVNLRLAEALKNVNSSNINDPQAIFEVGERVREIVQANRRVFVPRLEDLQRDLEVNLDTVSALQRGLSDEDAAIGTAAEGRRAGIINSGQGPITLDRVNQPSRILDQQTEEFLQRVGGETAEEQTDTMLRGADTLAESGRREVVQANQNYQQRAEEFNRSASEWISDLADDVELSEEISRLSDVTGTEIDLSRTAARNDILSQIEQGYVAMRDRKNELYEQIRGGSIDVDGFVGLLDELQPGQITAAEQQLRSSSPLRRLFQEAQPQQITEEGLDGSPVTRIETDEERLERFSDFLQAEGMDFGRLYQEVRPELSQLAEQFAGPNGNIAVTRTLRDVIRWIDDDQVEYVADSNPELAEAARAAHNYYKEQFAPLFRDGRLAEYSELYDSTIGRGEAFRVTDYRSGRRSIVDGAIQGGDAALVQQFKDLLERPEAGASSGRLADYIVADTISDAATALRSSSGTDMNIGAYIGRLRQYSEVLNDVFPERANALNEFVLRVEQAQGDRKQLQALMEEARANVTATKQEVATGELQSFFRREFAQDADPLLRDLATASDPQAAFRSVLLSNRNDTTATVQALMDRAAGLPAAERQAVLDGIQTAYTRILRDQIFGRRMESGGNRPVNPARIQTSAEEMNSLFRVGEQVFRGSPEVMETVRFMSELAGVVAQSRNATPISSMSATAFNQQAMSATNRIIYMTIGPLSRLGTQVRSIVGTFVQSKNANERASQILDNIFADPEYFAELSRRYNRQPNDPVAQEMLLRALIAGGVRSTEDDDTPFIERASNAETQMMQGLDNLTQEMNGLFR